MCFINVSAQSVNCNFSASYSSQPPGPSNCPPYRTTPTRTPHSMLQVKELLLHAPLHSPSSPPHFLLHVTFSSSPHPCHLIHLNSITPLFNEPSFTPSPGPEYSDSDYLGNSSLSETVGVVGGPRYPTPLSPLLPLPSSPTPPKPPSPQVPCWHLLQALPRGEGEGLHREQGGRQGRPSCWLIL